MANEGQAIVVKLRQYVIPGRTVTMTIPRNPVTEAIGAAGRKMAVTLRDRRHPAGTVAAQLWDDRNQSHGPQRCGLPISPHDAGFRHDERGWYITEDVTFTPESIVRILGMDHPPLDDDDYCLLCSDGGPVARLEDHDIDCAWRLAHVWVGQQA